MDVDLGKSEIAVWPWHLPKINDLSSKELVVQNAGDPYLHSAVRCHHQSPPRLLKKGLKTAESKTPDADDICMSLRCQPIGMYMNGSIHMSIRRPFFLAKIWTRDIMKDPCWFAHQIAPIIKSPDTVLVKRDICNICIKVCR